MSKKGKARRTPEQRVADRKARAHREFVRRNESAEVFLQKIFGGKRVIK